jgi:glycosyltransferase involved in cell wall biosynthesis
VYRESDILVFPALFSNGNFTILECMASGMGIVVSDRIQGQIETITHGVNGYVCPPEKGAFIAAIQQYLDDPSKLQSHARINRDLVRPYSVAGTAELYHRTISELLQRRAESRESL